MSIHNEEFYIDFQKFGLALNQDEVFQQINYPAEALGLMSIITGNDKNPGFRSCTRKPAIATYLSRKDTYGILLTKLDNLITICSHN